MFRGALYSILIVMLAILVGLNFMGPDTQKDQAYKVASGSFKVSRFNVPSAGPLRGYFYEAPRDKFKSHTVSYWFQQRRYHAYVGRKAKDTIARPTVFLLHGSGRTGASMVDMWQKTADQHGLVLIAPDSALQRGWSSWFDPPALLEVMIEDAVERYNIDRSQIFLFGHSAGGIYASLLALEEASPFQSIATHAGFPNASIIAQTKAPTGRKPPITHFLGTKDHLFDVESALVMGEAFAEAGYTTELVLMDRHTHWFYNIGLEISRKAMSIFQRRQGVKNRVSRDTRR
ncbi:alpha/beta hydrolase family esterase [Pseudovibrio sp. SCP19]|uniref:alpha/beta hydrolase family esterase n=1 Tax=Pseudovibrio sp. SCP19 TaxID=3141374 RepID=UPI003337D950